MDILNYTKCANVDKVQVPAVGCYGNPLDVPHEDSIGGPSSKASCVGHLLFWVPCQLNESILKASVSLLFLMETFLHLLQNF